MLEFEYGAAFVGAFAPLEGGRKFGTLLALETLYGCGATVREKFLYFTCGEYVPGDGFEQREVAVAAFGSARAENRVLVFFEQFAAERALVFRLLPVDLAVARN